MIPLSDENLYLRPPAMTLLLLGAMFAVWILVEGAGFNTYTMLAAVCNYGMVPGEITHMAPLGYALPLGQGLACVIDNSKINIFTPLLSIFLHGGWLHILGNAVFFWVFARAVEDTMGPGRFLVFFLTCGLIAAGTQIASDPASPVPTVGASGAISGVMGAYLLLYPRVRIHMLFIFIIFFKVFRIPAWIVLIWWFAVQLLQALPELSSSGPNVSGGVAVWAHVGGFLAGILLIRVFTKPELMDRRAAMMHGYQPA
ncbi:MAG: rhomboid family intramembrane serine protease [Gemmatimonadota bacterium]|nr:rhomboid family intramembrane serine protease [Gemmatimonadota bacterium]MDE3128846.1 rhomboid family intramembrane serine protease [Gemmatimonadota bacterium]MDE3174325.1 rhomboid family intramembrane serine protease [Gemmatimonadota bacterium]